MWHKGSNEGVTDQGVWGPRGKGRDGVTVKDGGRVWVKNTDQRRKLEKGINYIQGTDVNTPRAWCSHDGYMNMHITQTQEGYLVQENCDSVTVQKFVL